MYQPGVKWTFSSNSLSPNKGLDANQKHGFVSFCMSKNQRIKVHPKKKTKKTYYFVLLVNCTNVITGYIRLIQDLLFYNENVAKAKYIVDCSWGRRKYPGKNNVTTTKDSRTLANPETNKEDI